MSSNQIYNIDCLEAIKLLPDNSIDIIFTDPPYGLGSEVIIKENGKPEYKKAVDFMSKWQQPDGVFWEEWFKEAKRVLKHGGHCLIFGMDRQIWFNCYYANLAGFTQKQSLYWFFISNFPKASSLSKNLDKYFGAEREVIGERIVYDIRNNNLMVAHDEKLNKDKLTMVCQYTAPASILSKKYNNLKYGIAPLKQTNETILVFQKPYKTGSCLHDILALENGNETITCGALDTEGNRVGFGKVQGGGGELGKQIYGKLKRELGSIVENTGRFPAQTFVNSEAAERLGDNSKILHKCDFEQGDFEIYNYCPKVAKAERGEDNNHPTLKPKKLLTQILKLFKTPNKQILLDPFMGSGSMGLACSELDFDYIGYELDPEYFKIAEARLKNCKPSLFSILQET